MSVQGGAERPFELGLMFTHRCPIACRHCGILSGPDNHESMDVDFALDCIDQAARLDPAPATLVFTGGEPMMYPHVLERLLERCNRLGLPTRVVTNGFWARNPTRGRRLLHRLRLAGLDSLNFSADKYHLEFLPAAVFREAIEIAWEVGFPVIVNFVLNEKGDPVARFSSLYGVDPDRIRLFDEDDFVKSAASGAPDREALTKINLSFGRLVGLGRAADYPDEHLLSPIAEFAVGACGEVGNRPVIYPDGSFQACCCAGGKIESFTVGDVNERSLADLVADMRGRAHFKFINRFGPRALFELSAEMLPERPRAEVHASICDVCVQATCGIAPRQVDRMIDEWGLSKLLADAQPPV